MTRLHVLAVLSDLGAGGAERSTAEAIGPLAERGIDLEIVTLSGATDGVRNTLPADHVVHELHDRPSRRKVADLRELIRTRHADVVHTAVFEADILGRLAAWRTRAPVLTSLVNAQYERTRRGDPAVRRWKLEIARGIEALTAKSLTYHFHAISEAAASAAVRDLHVSKSRITVIPRGRRRDRLGSPSPERRALVRAELGIASDAPVVLNLGRQEWQKGHEVLLGAAARLLVRHPDLVVLVGGREGNRTRTLLDVQAKLGLSASVRFLGHVDDVGGLLAAADVFAFPSRYEGLGGALLEAMAMECPIVTSETPATKEAVGNAALLVPIDDEVALSDSIHRLIETPRLAADLAQRGLRRYHDRFDFDVVMDQMADLYQRVASRSL